MRPNQKSKREMVLAWTKMAGSEMEEKWICDIISTCWWIEFGEEEKSETKNY